jgi:hypothetical protein
MPGEVEEQLMKANVKSKGIVDSILNLLDRQARSQVAFNFSNALAMFAVLSTLYCTWYIETNDHDDSDSASHSNHDGRGTSCFAPTPHAHIVTEIQLD